MRLDDCKKAPTTAYRPCVGIVLLNKNNDVFIGRRLDSRALAWQMPQGGVDAGEDIATAAQREVFEETGVKNAQMISILPSTYRYDLPQALRDRLPWGRQYGGQEQTWVILRHTGTDHDIDLRAHEPAEFCAWRWCPLSEIPDIAVPFKRHVYAGVTAEVGAFLQSAA